MNDFRVHVTTEPLEMLQTRKGTRLDNTNEAIRIIGRVGRWHGRLGVAKRLPALSVAGASRAKPYPVSTSPSSNRTCASDCTCSHLFPTSCGTAYHCGCRAAPARGLVCCAWTE